MALRELLWKILTVMDEEIRPSAKPDEISKTRILPAVFAKLVVRKKHKRRGPFDELESHTALRMLQVVSLHSRVPDLESTPSQIVPLLDLGFEIVKRYGPGSVDVSWPENVLQSLETLAKAVDDYSAIVAEQWGEERESHQVIPVDMGHEQVKLQGITALRQGVSQLPHASSCIDNDGSAGRQGDLEAGGVAAINHSFRSWGSYRASCPPKGYFHVILWYRA
jgi:hypothetical protein